MQKTVAFEAITLSTINSPECSDEQTRVMVSPQFNANLCETSGECEEFCKISGECNEIT